jgi:hypothetical protein
MIWYGYIPEQVEGFTLLHNFMSLNGGESWMYTSTTVCLKAAV